MALLHPDISARYSLGPVKPWVEQAAYFLGPRHNITKILGWRKTDPFPDHPSGHALDYMIPNLTVGADLAQDAINNAQALGVKYIIFNHRVWNPKQGWHPYTSTSNPHTDHVHITFNDTPGTGIATGGIASPTAGSGTVAPESNVDNATCAWHFKFPVAGDTCILSKTQVRAMFAILIIAGGVAVTGIGVWLLLQYGLNNTKTGREVSDTAKSAALVAAL